MLTDKPSDGYVFCSDCGEEVPEDDAIDIAGLPYCDLCADNLEYDAEDE
jgi:formylmethanofuran dehydrogenase subunit E